MIIDSKVVMKTSLYQQLMRIAVLAYRASLQYEDGHPEEHKMLDSYIGEGIEEQLWVEIDQLSETDD